MSIHAKGSAWSEWAFLGGIARWLLNDEGPHMLLRSRTDIISQVQSQNVSILRLCSATMTWINRIEAQVIRWPEKRCDDPSFLELVGNHPCEYHLQIGSGAH